MNCNFQILFGVVIGFVIAASYLSWKEFVQLPAELWAFLVALAGPALAVFVSTLISGHKERTRKDALIRLAKLRECGVVLRNKLEAQNVISTNDEQEMLNWLGKLSI